MKKFIDLEASAKQATILVLVGSALKIFLGAEYYDEVADRLPLKVYDDLMLLSCNHHPKSNTPLTLSACDRILERVAIELNDFALKQTENTEYSDYHSISFSVEGWCRSVINMNPKYVIKKEPK